MGTADITSLALAFSHRKGEGKAGDLHFGEIFKGEAVLGPLGLFGIADTLGGNGFCRAVGKGEDERGGQTARGEDRGGQGAVLAEVDLRTEATVVGRAEGDTLLLGVHAERALVEHIDIVIADAAVRKDSLGAQPCGTTR